MPILLFFSSFYFGLDCHRHQWLTRNCCFFFICFVLVMQIEKLNIIKPDENYPRNYICYVHYGLIKISFNARSTKHVSKCSLVLYQPLSLYQYRNRCRCGCGCVSFIIIVFFFHCIFHRLLVHFDAIPCSAYY